MSSELKPLTVAVFGANGYTGKFVVNELLRRGIKPIAIARNPTALAALNFPEDKVELRHATVDDPNSLDRVLIGAQAIINCAGPFSNTAEPIAAAALRAGIHYLDVAAEQPSTRAILEKYDELAKKAGVVVLPALAFYGGLPDLMVTAILRDWDSADSIEIAFGLDSWHPTVGTRNTLAVLSGGAHQVISGGRLVPASPTPARTHWDFGSHLGNQPLTEVPFPEAFLIPRHIKTSELHNYLTSNAIGDVANASTPGPKSVDESGRSPQKFIVEVEVKKGKETRRAILRGQDSYAASASLISEAVERILKGRGHFVSGARAPGEVFDAQEILSVFDPGYSTFEVQI